jgi:uncharacterized protein
LIAVDTNVLVYAHREDSPVHVAAFRCMAELAQGRAAWAIPWPCIHEFFAVVTHPRIYNPPTPVERALDQINAWMESPTLVLLVETEAHWSVLSGLLANGRVVGPAVHDARIAALCRQHEVKELWSADRDFSRFAGLVVVNPLVSS